PDIEVVVDLGFDPRVELVMWYTTSQEDYPFLRPLSYTDADVFVVCFSVEDPNSLDSIAEKAREEGWGTAMARHVRACAYVEISAKYNDGLADLLARTARAAVQQQPGKSVAHSKRKMGRCRWL
ncbi:hypothetical protein HK405_014863, partial [Cladochytrium tenue]